MDEVRSRLRTAVWNQREERLRAPFRLTVAAVAVVVLAEVLALVGVPLAQVNAGIRPVVRAAWTVVVTGLALATGLVGLVAIARLVDRRRPADLGLGRSRDWLAEVAVGMGVGAAMVVAVVLAALALGLGHVEGVLAARNGDFALTSQYPLLNGAFWLVVFLGVGAVEEVLVRGYVLVNVAEGLRGQVADHRRATAVAVVVSALVFGVLHAGNPGGSSLAVLTVLAFGLLLGATMALTGRLALAIGVHVAWNATLGVGFGLPVSGLETGVAVLAVDLSGPDLVVGGTFGPESGAVALVGLAVGVVLLGLVLARRPDGLSVDPRITQPDLYPRSDVED